MNSKLNKLDVESKLNEIYRLKSIVRYNNRPKLSEETVAEHSFYVALIGMMICDELGTSNECKYEVMTKALLHDMPEMEINDITHDVKIRLHLEEFLAQYENEYYEKNFENYAELMRRHGTKADIILDLADAMSVKQFCLHEMSLGNISYTMRDIHMEAESRIAKLKEQLEKEN